MPISHTLKQLQYLTDYSLLLWLLVCEKRDASTGIESSTPNISQQPTSEGEILNYFEYLLIYTLQSTTIGDEYLLLHTTVLRLSLAVK